jgi:hypothetical protein
MAKAFLPGERPWLTSERTNPTTTTNGQMPSSRVGEVPDPVVRQTTRPPEAISPSDVRTAAQCLTDVTTLYLEYREPGCPKDRRRALERLIRVASVRYKQLERAALRIVR